MRSAQVKGIVLRPGGAVQVGGQVVMMEEAAAHRANGGAAHSAPELRGVWGGPGDEPAAKVPGAYAGVGGHATPGGDAAGAAFERTPEHDREHKAGLRRLGINSFEVSLDFCVAFCGVATLSRFSCEVEEVWLCCARFLCSQCLMQERLWGSWMRFLNPLYYACV